MHNPTVICLMGPTASGKTALAIELAQCLPCDIISVDSAMVYRGMDIGTAKPTQAELAIAPHRLLDILDPAVPYSAGKFCTDALNEIEQVLAKGRIPLLVGGTMLYFRALQQGISQLPTADAYLRQQLAAEAQVAGWSSLHQRLNQLDPASAQRISPNDAQRIARALEVCVLTGKPFSEFCVQTKIAPPAYRFVNIGLLPQNRESLKERIRLRFKSMLQKGFIDEVIKLQQRADLHPELPALRAVGYRQVWDYLGGKVTWTEMENSGIIATCRLAKRQLTWLRSWPSLRSFDYEDRSLVTQIIKQISSG